MLTPEQITVFGDQAQKLAEPVTEFLIKDIARRIAEAGQLTSTAAYQVWRTQQLGVSQRELKKQLRKILKVSHRELRQMLTQAAEVGYDFDIKRLPYVQALPFDQNASLQKVVEAAVKLALDDFTNLTQTLGMIDPHGIALPLQDAYRSCTDFAFKQIITGAADYNTAVRRATKNLAERGVLTIDYQSGVHTSLEAAVRRNMMGGLGLMQEQISQSNHDALGCDGWEISAHANSAPDHEPIQGRQYTDAEYTALNNSLVRRIGTLNCGHAAFPVILGVNEPQYTPEQLEQLRADNEKGVTIDGKHYTGYEATQMQRKLERAIRKQKRRVLTAEAAGDTERLPAKQTRLELLRQEYSRFSKAAGLRTEDERFHVAGFGHKEAARATAEYKRVENLANSMYDIGSTKENVTAWLRDKPVREQIGSERYPLKLHVGRQNKHVPGTNEYKQYVAKFAKQGQYGPSRLTIDEAAISNLVSKYHGTGILLKSDDGRWRSIERITIHPEEIGVAVNNLTGVEAATTTFTIRYSKDGFHIVPDYPSRKGEKAKR